jgi:transposase
MIQLEFTKETITKLRHNAIYHPHPTVRTKSQSCIMKYENIPHHKIASTLDICENTLRGYFQQYQDGGIEKLEKLNFYKPQSELVNHTDTIKTYLEKNPPATIKEACHKINELTKLNLSVSAMAKYLKSLGLKYRKPGTIPAKADVIKQKKFLEEELKPRLAEAKEGKRALYFADAAHFVLAPFLGYLWSFVRLFIKAPAGRQRFNVLGAINAFTHKLITVTNDSYINAQSVCELLRKLAQEHLTTPITIVLDNAKYQKCILVAELAAQLKIELLYLPSYSPNLNIIERLWKYVKKSCLNGKYYENFAIFTAGILKCLNSLPEHEDELDTLLALNFQDFSKVKS